MRLTLTTQENWQQSGLFAASLPDDDEQPICDHDATEVQPRLFDDGYDLVCCSCGAIVSSEPGTTPG